MNFDEIRKLLKELYGINPTDQGLYEWAKDSIKYYNNGLSLEEACRKSASEFKSYIDNRNVIRNSKYINEKKSFFTLMTLQGILDNLKDNMDLK